ncbi:hypothetical protein [Devosia sp. 2618]|uniref:hypothetical protein n=1 Tax=Devosia sp. 2618 TaxID=3156454 RepID=UPI003394C37A
MSQVANKSDLPVSTAARRTGRVNLKPFAGLIDAVTVRDATPFQLAGSISHDNAEHGWIWVYRDLCPDLIDPETAAGGKVTAAELEQIMPQILSRMNASLDSAAKDQENNRRLRAALGSSEARDAIPVIIMALRSRALLGKAQAFGKALNTTADDAALATALQSMPLKDQALASLLFQAAIGYVANPTRIVAAIVKLSGNSSEAAVQRMGFSPVVEAMLAHAQNQLHVLQPTGPFADIDLICRCLDRFHRLVRALSGYIEFARGSRWATILAGATKQVSDRIEPRLRDVVPDINQAMRRGREGSDRLDNDRILAAVNGVYLMATIRECRDSLALNAMFDQAWSQSGQALELHLQRNLDLVRQHPGDAIIGARLDAGIKMAEIRFNPEYADTLRRARAAAERRA